MCCSIWQSSPKKSRFLHFCCWICGWFISIVRMLHILFCLFGAQPLCYLIYLRDLGPCHFVRGFLWGPKYSCVSYIIIFKVFIFQYFGYFKVFIFQYFGSLERVFGSLHCIWIMLRYLNKWEPSCVFFNLVLPHV